MVSKDSETATQKRANKQRIRPPLDPMHGGDEATLAQNSDKSGRENHREELIGLVNVQVARYRWFDARVEPSRSVSELADVLSEPAQKPGAWERAMVELSKIETLTAWVVLEEWEAPEDRRELDVFRQLCAARVYDACFVDET